VEIRIVREAGKDLDRLHGPIAKKLERRNTLGYCVKEGREGGRERGRERMR
jgi:hypothetical protein